MSDLFTEPHSLTRFCEAKVQIIYEIGTRMGDKLQFDEASPPNGLTP